MPLRLSGRGVARRNAETRRMVVLDVGSLACGTRSWRSAGRVGHPPLRDWWKLTSSAILLVLLVDKVIRHSGDVVANYAGERFLPGFFLIALRQALRFCHPEFE
jgi:hypothetical protein